MTAMLNTLAPKLDKPPSPIPACIIKVMVMLTNPAKGPKITAVDVAPRKCQVLPPPATGNSTSWMTKSNALITAIKGMKDCGRVFLTFIQAHARKHPDMMNNAMHA